MPGAAVGVRLGSRERAVRGAPLVRRRGAVRGRARERMAERELIAAHGDQPRALGGGQRREVQPERRRRPFEHRELARVLGRGQRQQPPRGLGQRGDPGRERVLDARLDPQHGPGSSGRWRPARRARAGCPASPRTAGRRRRAAAGRRRGARAPRPPPRGRALRARASGGRRRGARVAITIATASANRRRAANRIAPSEDSSSHCASSTATSTGRSSASAASRLSVAAADQEALAADARRQPERRAQRRRLRLRQLVEPVERRPQQRVQAGERDLRLGLDPARPQHEHALRALDGVLEQRRLADPGRAGEHERLARAQPRGGQQLLDAGELGVSPDQHGAILSGWRRPIAYPRRVTASAVPSGDQTGGLR